VSPTVWVQTAYTKAKVDELLELKQDILTEGAFVDGDKIKLDNIEDGATADQTASEIKTAYESNADTNALTDTLKALLEAKKVKNVTTDSLNDKLVITYTDDTVANLNINDIVTDVKVSGATLDATTNVLTLTSTDGGADVTVDLSDFVNSGELTSALSGKADNIHSHSTSDITGLDTTLSNLATDLSNKQETLVSGTSIKTINGQSVLGSGDIVITGGGSGGEVDLTNYYTKSETYNKVETNSLVNTKQDTLVSATNIKTINGESILGSGDLVISGGGAVDLSEYYKKTETYSKVEVDTKIADIPETDLSGYYKKTETYNKIEVDTIIDTIPEVDQSDILFGIEQDVDFIAASFVRSAKDVLEIRELLNANGGNNINIISKIENSEGVNHIDDIIYVSDGIMVARGDMGVEIPLEDVPVIQKETIIH
jgi:hypothetical protein